MEAPLATEVAEPAAPAPAPADWGAVVAREAADGSFGVGPLLSRSFSIWGRNLLRIGLVGLLCSIPLALYSYHLYRGKPVLGASPFSRPGVVPERAEVLRWLGETGLQVGWTMLLSTLTGALQLGAVCAGVMRAQRGEPVKVGGMLSAGFRRYLPMAGMLLLSSLAFAPTLCLVVPAVVLMCGWCVAAPVVVAERLGPVRALGRSWALTRGRRWKILGGFLVLAACFWGFSAAEQAAALGLTLLAQGPAAIRSGPAMALPGALNTLAAGVAGTLLPVAQAVAYQALRLDKEGGDPVLLAKVFE